MNKGSKRSGVSGFVPSRFCVISGSAVSRLSSLNAFDSALQKAGIENCNLVSVTSIIPSDAKQVNLPKMLPGTVVFAVYIAMEGTGGEVGTGIAWGWGTTKEGGRLGIVAEAKGKDPGSLESELIDKLNAMARIRGLKLEKPEIRIEFIDVPTGHYGCSFSALVFLPQNETIG